MRHPHILSKKYVFSVITMTSENYSEVFCMTSSAVTLTNVDMLWSLIKTAFQCDYFSAWFVLMLLSCTASIYVHGPKSMTKTENIPHEISLSFWSPSINLKISFNNCFLMSVSIIFLKPSLFCLGTFLMLQSKTVCSVWIVSINHNWKALGQLQIPFD